MFKKLIATIASLALVLALPIMAMAQGYDTSLYDSSNLGSTYNSTLTDAQATAITGVAMLFTGVILVVELVVGLAMYVYMGLTLSTIAKKIKAENSWFAWVPILNLVLLAQMAEINPAMLLIFLIPIAGAFYGIYFSAVAYMKIAEKRGLDKYLGLLIFVPVVNFIFMGYLAWAKIEPMKVTSTPVVPVVPAA